MFGFFIVIFGFWFLFLAWIFPCFPKCLPFPTMSPVFPCLCCLCLSMDAFRLSFIVTSRFILVSGFSCASFTSCLCLLASIVIVCSVFINHTCIFGSFLLVSQPRCFPPSWRSCWCLLFVGWLLSMSSTVTEPVQRLFDTRPAPLQSLNQNEPLTCSKVSAWVLSSPSSEDPPSVPGSWVACRGILSPVPVSYTASLSPLQPALQTSEPPSRVASSASHGSQLSGQLFGSLAFQPQGRLAITLCLSDPLLLAAWWIQFLLRSHESRVQLDIWWVIHTTLHHAFSNNCACPSSQYPFSIFYTKSFKNETLRFVVIVQIVDDVMKVTFLPIQASTCWSLQLTGN